MLIGLAGGTDFADTAPESSLLWELRGRAWRGQIEVGKSAPDNGEGHTLRAASS